MDEPGRNAQRLTQMRWAGTALVAAFVWALLAWEHSHGGVVTHNLLARDDLPGLSNAWGGVVLPLLAWFLLGRMRRRLAAPRPGGTAAGARGMLAGFAGAAIYGGLIAYFFSAGRGEVTSTMATALLPLALLLPIHRAEYVLGFVLAMAYTFGGVLPVLFATVVAAAGFVIHRGARQALAAVGAWRQRRSMRSATTSR